MIIHDLQQGSAEWLAHRATHFNASDAPAMMGISPHKSRGQLLREMSTGIVPDVDAATQFRFTEGHRAEALARPLAEKIIGEELFPVVGSGGDLSASFDGITMDASTCWEHKRLSDSLVAALDGGEIPKYHRAQMEAQLMVSGATRCLFSATRWTPDGKLEAERHVWYEPDAYLRARIVAGWEQFKLDLEGYQPDEIIEPPRASAIMELPAIYVQVQGAVTASNLPEFKTAAADFIAAIKTDLQTDEDFAQAEATVKFCKKAEENLEAAKKNALAQTASIDEMMRTVDHIQSQLREKRLLLDRLVKTEKEARKSEIVTRARQAFAEHIGDLEKEIAPIRMSISVPDFALELRGKKSLRSMNDAVGTALANAKISANQDASDTRAKLTFWREESQGFSFLFNDLQQIISKHRDDFNLLVTTRIEQHKSAEMARQDAERARIRGEEEHRATEKLAREREMVRVEEEKRARILAAQEQKKGAPVMAGEKALPEKNHVAMPVEEKTLSVDEALVIADNMQGEFFISPEWRAVLVLAAEVRRLRKEIKK